MTVEALNGFTSTTSIFRFAQSERNQREAGGEVFILQVEKALKRHLITLMRSEGKLVWATRKSKFNKKVRYKGSYKGKHTEIKIRGEERKLNELSQENV
jgi:hypothetical protein